MVKVTADRQDKLAAHKETKQARFIGEARKLANVLVVARSADRHGSILVKEADEWTAGHIPSSALRTGRLSMNPVSHILQAIVNDPASGATAISEPNLMYVAAIPDWKRQLTELFLWNLRLHVRRHRLQAIHLAHGRIRCLFGLRAARERHDTCAGEDQLRSLLRLSGHTYQRRRHLSTVWRNLCM